MSEHCFVALILTDVFRMLAAIDDNTAKSGHDQFVLLNARIQLHGVYDGDNSPRCFWLSGSVGIHRTLVL